MKETKVWETFVKKNRYLIFQITNYYFWQKYCKKRSSIIMNIKVTLLAIIFISLMWSSCSREDAPLSKLDERLRIALDLSSKGQGVDYYKLPDSEDFTNIPQDPKNPINSAKVQLGQLLFHETALAQNPRHVLGVGTYSCASCHHAPGGFQACVSQGIGEGGVGFGATGEARIPNATYVLDSIDVQPIRTPSILNVAYQTNMLWNGQFGATHKNVGTESEWKEGTPIAKNKLGFEGTEIQAIAGLGVHRLVAEDSIFTDMPTYQNLFEKAFSNLPTDDRISNVTAGLAIAAYERTVMPTQAPFQYWLDGDVNAMNDAEKRGAILFFSKAKCASCHNGPALNSMEFYALGMHDLTNEGEVYNVPIDDSAHKGRGGFTKKAADMYKFKVPQLYNLGDSPFYGHGASFKSVVDIVKYKSQAVPENLAVPSSQLAQDFVPLHLTNQEIEDIAAFIENGLRDPYLRRYQPASLPSGNCFPNNDPNSKDDLGCN